MPKISIVGVGPGAPDLLTIRAYERLRNADVLVWTDSLISPQIIEMASNECELIKTSVLTLEEIVPLLIDRALQGKRVVRLHDGDPCLYGALSEQIYQLTEADIEIEVIPGISAYQATAAALKAELTIPGVTQTIVIGRAGGRTGVPDKERLEHLASIGSTLCLYLSARHVEQVEGVLLNYYSENTPVAIAYRVGWKDEWIQVIPLHQMATISKERNLIRTTLYVVSPALNATKNRSNLYNPNYAHLFRPEG